MFSFFTFDTDKKFFFSRALVSNWILRVNLIHLQLNHWQKKQSFSLKLDYCNGMLRLYLNLSTTTTLWAVSFIPYVSSHSYNAILQSKLYLFIKIRMEILLSFFCAMDSRVALTGQSPSFLVGLKNFVPLKKLLKRRR